VLCLVHHVHREQWNMNFPPLWARFGWWVESRLSPRVYRRSRHITVSETSRRELLATGVEPPIEIVHNGADPRTPATAKSDRPTILCLGRLVPHKRVELALEATARLLPVIPDLHVVVMGQGQWQPQLEDLAARLGLDGAVTFTGWVSEREKLRLLDE